jgi:hypothetical protein
MSGVPGPADLETARRIIPVQGARDRTGAADVGGPSPLNWAEKRLARLLGSHEQLPPAHIVADAAHLRRVVDRSLRLPLSREERHRAAVTRGRVTVLQADAAFKLGDPDQARRLAADAYATAAAVGEGPLCGSAREIGAVIEFYAGRPADAVRLAEDGLRHVGDGPVRVRLICQEARARAALGELSAAARSLSAAYELAEGISPEQQGRPGLSFTEFHPVEVAYNATTALCLLDRPLAAAKHAAVAVAVLDTIEAPGFSSVIRMDLALAKARVGRLELEEACALATEAVAISWNRAIASVSARANQLLAATRGHREVRSVGELASLVREWQRGAPTQRPASDGRRTDGWTGQGGQGDQGGRRGRTDDGSGPGAGPPGQNGI